MTTVNFPSGDTYTDADPTAEAAAKIAAEGRVTADPASAKKPAAWPTAPAHTTVKNGVVTGK